MGYYQMNEKLAIEYLVEHGVFDSATGLTAKEVGDGNLNLVFIVKDEATENSVVLKQALPYVRVVGESWPLSIERTIVEANALEIYNNLTPNYVPKLIHRNDQLSLIVMEDLSHLELMRYGMIKMQKYPSFPEHASTFLADTLFYTSDMYLSSEEKKKLVAKFINIELCKITEDLIFTDPYHDADTNNINPRLRPYLEEVFWKKTDLWREVSKLKYKFMTEAQSLIHGDLHTGSIFAGENETKIFDAEFAFMGPAAFDVGKIIGNIFINYISWSGKDEDPERIKDYRSYLLETVIRLHRFFERKFIENWKKDALNISARAEGYRDDFMNNLFTDTIGFCGAVMIRRTHGLAQNLDVTGIEDLQKRRDVQVKLLELGEKLIMNRHSFNNLEEVTNLIKENIE
ncbi:S-methyl-5-thioribose kinase [Alkaliphilus pronyensis]|uniref:S-methyl-5-thioribose kinase n=1 Tax=Alkaliphilus pronyensis TaxID=1482732 RepID=A0A6I0F9I1_9FIRM|nr:S-methyl-5-thioribose kinase [Alkaliphilus pronyensis]KAB3535444.1 S-methyl-5-thioribose kinase [Alkaliphilus pronyensis]